MVQSPCINICKMNAANGLCTGCWRTLDEIAAWSRLADTARSAILTAVQQRRQNQPPQPTRHD